MQRKVAVTQSKTYPIVAVVSFGRGKQFILNLGFSCREDEWDSDNKRIIGMTNFQNSVLADRIREIRRITEETAPRAKEMDMCSIRMQYVKVVGMCKVSSSMLKTMVSVRFGAYMDRMERPGTKLLYKQTLDHVRRFCGKDISIYQITPQWLREFEAFMLKDHRINSVGIAMRNIRAVINDAIDSEIVTNYSYPFKRFKIRKEKSQQLFLTIEEVKRIRDWHDPMRQKYIDIWMLIFYLGGINIGDLCMIENKDYRDGRIYYCRQKTHGEVQSVRVYDEARVIIEKYRGVRYMLDIMEHYACYHSFAQQLNHAMQSLGESVRVPKVQYTGRTMHVYKIIPQWPGINTYTARRTFATIASEDCDISRDTIGRILGHSEANVTSIYISKRRDKEDRAIRMVLDTLL